MTASPEPIDLTLCDEEPIHLAGRVQGFAGLIAVTPDWVVAHVSRNAAARLGVAATEMLGAPLSRWIPAETIHELRNRIQIMGGDPARAFGLDLFGDGRLFDLAAHRTGELTLIEFEEKREASPERTSLVRPLLGRISAQPDAEGLARAGAGALKALTGFDRVMVYRFEPDWTGTVIAEARGPEQGSFLGLRFPSTDIPAQARALYARAPLRLIEDVDGPTFEIEPALTASGAPLDLSLSVSRAVSPVHLEYLRNMGVAASMSASIMRGGRLWGLFACHHDTPRHVDYELRTAVELFAQLFSYELAQKERDAEQGAERRGAALRDGLMARVAGAGGIAECFEDIAAEIGGVIAHDGIALLAGGGVLSAGEVPGEADLADIARHLGAEAGGRVHATDRLGEEMPAARAFADRAAGLLALPLSRAPSDYLILFRREVTRDVLWGGRPELTLVPSDGGGMRPSPRKSFEAWREIASGTSAPWTVADLRAAEALRTTLLEVVLDLSGEAERARARDSQRQDLLIAELNHRVRNILNLIRGLVQQGVEGEEGIESYAATLGGRISALAQAHDQLMSDGIGAISLRDLIAVETAPFAPGGERVRVTGPDAMVEPEAFTALVLVVHELVTNAAKHGALSTPEGRIDVELGRGESGDLILEWQESGGPAVRPPGRRGFGTTIIERSVPYELGGTARVEHAPEGLRARFSVPARHLVAGAAAPQRAEPLHGEGLGAVDLSCVLLVEDNLVISLDATGVLQDFGAGRVLVAPSVRQALSLIEEEPVSIAVLDVNLGSETSQAVAHALSARAVPFVLATGYAAPGAGIDGLAGVPVLRKPYDGIALRSALGQLS